LLPAGRRRSASQTRTAPARSMLTSRRPSGLKTKASTVAALYACQKNIAAWD